MNTKKLKAAAALETPCSVYLPNEGLQGEEIPSNVTWKSDISVELIKIRYREPLKIKEVFNASNYEIKDDEVLAKKIEVNGYLGLSFETSKIDEIEAELPVNYTIIMANGEELQVQKTIKLFKPKLRVRLPKDSISIEPKTSFIKDRLKVKNVGRGLLLIRIRNAEESQLKIETPKEYKEFAEKFNQDLMLEFTNLSEMFPSFKPFQTYFLNCADVNFLEATDCEKEELKRNLAGFANLLASDKNLLGGFVESFARAILKNNQFQEAIRKVIMVYESLVTKDILLLNPLDEILITQKENSIKLEILLTDNVYDDYKNMVLPEIKIKAEPNTRIPIHKIIEWS